VQPQTTCAAYSSCPCLGSRCVQRSAKQCWHISCAELIRVVLSC
jgi:hypothetical protein